LRCLDLIAENVFVERESEDFVVFRFYMFGRDKEGVKLHVNNNSLTIEDPDPIQFN